jgi:hypothetical protein
MDLIRARCNVTVALFSREIDTMQRAYRKVYRTISPLF